MILHGENVTVSFGDFTAVDGVTFHAQAGETLAIVGESGSGKTTLARAILGLQPLKSGRITVNGRDVKGVEPGQAERIGIVWQDPSASCDPRWTVRQIVEEPWRLLGRTGDTDALLASCGLDPSLGERYPHQLSGGQRQRVAIARALALRPPVVICDEPTAALDLSVQAQILNLLQDLKAETGATFLYISHDLETVRYLADRVMVMQNGQVVEEGVAETVLGSPQHPYTQALMASVPQLDRLGVIPG